MQLENYQETFGDLIELVYLKAPHQMGASRIKAFKAFKGPHLMWAQDEFDRKMIKAGKYDTPPGEVYLHLMDQSIKYLFNYLNANKDVKFDGFLAFS